MSRELDECKPLQLGFYQFGMELLMSLRIDQMRNFFTTFFALPMELSSGFLGNRQGQGRY